MKLLGKSLIITDSVSVVNKLLRTKAKIENSCIANCKVQSLSQVVADIVNAYSALFENGRQYKLISFNEQTMLLSDELYENNYAFLPERAKGLKTAEEIIRVSNQIRLNDATQEYQYSINTKLLEIKGLLDSHEKTLAEKECLDSVMALRKAIEILEFVSTKQNSRAVLMVLLPQIKDAKIITCFSGNKKRLEQRFLDKLGEVANQDVLDISLSDICEHKKEIEYGFFKAYGITNEVAEVVKLIKDQRLLFGDVAIIYPEDTYENVLKSYFEFEGVPYSFPRGFRACSTQYVQLLISMLNFAKEDFAYKSLMAICENPLVNIPNIKNSFRLILKEKIGYKRERYLEFFNRYEAYDEDAESKNENVTKFVDFLRKLIDCFEPSKNCQGTYNSLLSLAKAITVNMDFYKQLLLEPLKMQSKVFGLVSKGTMDEIIVFIYDYLMQLKLPTAEDFGKVAIYPYGTVEVIDRDNIFVLGLSNENIAHTCSESPVFSDNELKRYADGSIDFALERNQKALGCFETTIALSTAKSVSMSYSYYDTGALIGNSPSLLFLDRLSAHGLDDEKLQIVGYDITFNKSVTLHLPPEPVDTKRIDAMKQPGYSASSLQTLLSCPLKFYYEKMKRVPQLDFRERRAEQWLQGGAKGDVFHHFMEDYVNQVIIKEGKTALDRSVFDTLFEKVMNTERIENPIPSEDIYNFEREECYECLERYINELHDELNNSIQGKKIIGCEIAFSDVSYSGGDVEKKTNFEISFAGFVDRVDGFVDEDGVLKLEIIDYKTSSIRSKEKEIKEGKQIQHYVYAMAILDYAKKNCSRLEEIFGRKISAFCIAGMKYVFPYETEQKELSIKELEGVSENIRMPIDYMLEGVEGLYQNDMPDQSYAFSKQISEAMKNDNEEHCKYCNYKNVCVLT